ncbi:hypothetical protein RFI_36346 [Reticulomyxa filosa]|uniref:Uncharacterized protein n=1 Tax=Reticulomyxa filosa TaxID=46433 RepID=X6LHK7_RETFI|nr:hypothetical protein RFI_36346 [Reticulomyxa filosa]|eukprot:ETO01094.1 hypothetical protein RFI_36346 [Reticulomyxa filosa]
MDTLFALDHAIERFVYGILKQLNNYVRLWDVRSGQQIQVFNIHSDWVNTVEYSPFVTDNNEISGISNVICSGSDDNTICFWDIRSNKDVLYVIKGNDEEDIGIISLKFLQLTNTEKKRKSNKDCNCGFYFCYGSSNGPIRIWG